MTPETQAKIAMWRSKAAEGTLTQEEMKEAILVLRGDRLSAAKASDSAKRKTAIKNIPSADDLLGELGEL